MKQLIVIVVAVVIAAGAVLRWIVVFPYPTGQGQSVVSPDGNFEADAMNFTDKGFWGSERQYYEFIAHPKGHMQSGSDTKTVRMYHLPGVMPFPMRSNRKIITWSTDSKSVTFAFQGIELKLNLEQENAAKR